MSNIIFETLMIEAVRKVAKLECNGVICEQAIQEVATDMELDGKEIAELKVRTKKSPKKATTSEPIVEEMPSEPVSPDNAIKFIPEDLETAVGVLMYKGIPWTGKTTDTLTFESSALVEQAKEALNRRWDFVSADPRRVAVVEFDNLEDYQKVLEFMASKKMTGSQLSSEGLEEDLVLEYANATSSHKKAAKEAKAAGFALPEAPAQNMSLSAQRKDSAIDLGSLNPLSEASARSIRIMKRWK